MVPGTQMKWVDLLWVLQGDHCEGRCDEPQADHCEVRCFPVVLHPVVRHLDEVEVVYWGGFPVVLEEAVVDWGVLGAVRPDQYFVLNLLQKPDRSGFCAESIGTESSLGPSLGFDNRLSS